MRATPLATATRLKRRSISSAAFLKYSQPPQMGQIGRVAHKGRGLDSLLDLQTIVRLKNHPEEIENQVKRYQQDRKTLDISTGAQEKWASFDAAISRAGRDIETRCLVGTSWP